MHDTGIYCISYEVYVGSCESSEPIEHADECSRTSSPREEGGGGKGQGVEEGEERVVHYSLEALETVLEWLGLLAQMWAAQTETNSSQQKICGVLKDGDSRF